MNLVEVPLIGADSSQLFSVKLTARVMNICQHLMAALLTTVGVIRAIVDGVPVQVALITGFAILAWHTAGSLLPVKNRSPRFAIWWLVGFSVIWLVAVAISAEFIWVAFLLWLLAGHLLSVKWGVLFSVLVLAVVITAPILHYGTTNYANIFGPAIGSVFAFAISLGYLQLLRDAVEREHLVASLTRTQSEMSELQDELALAQRHSGMIAERTRISRDIHDTIAQALSSIRLLAHAGANKTADPDASETLTQVESLAGDSLSDVRRIVAALAPAELEDAALAIALQRMLDRLRDETGLDGTLHVDETLPLLPTEVEVALLRTTQSALANVRLHAHATKVVMSLIDASDSVRLDIVDNGRGFDVSAWEKERELSSSSFGLRFMRARLRELGGGLDIESTVNEGTAISMNLPFHQDSAQPNSEVPH